MLDDPNLAAEWDYQDGDSEASLNLGQFCEVGLDSSMLKGVGVGFDGWIQGEGEEGRGLVRLRR